MSFSPPRTPEYSIHGSISSSPLRSPNSPPYQPGLEEEPQVSDDEDVFGPHSTQSEIGYLENIEEGSIISYGEVALDEPVDGALYINSIYLFV